MPVFQVPQARPSEVGRPNLAESSNRLSLSFELSRRPGQLDCRNTEAKDRPFNRRSRLGVDGPGSNLSYNFAAAKLPEIMSHQVQVNPIQKPDENVVLSAKLNVHI
jgi:hypothetical protein